MLCSTVQCGASGPLPLIQCLLRKVHDWLLELWFCSSHFYACADRVLPVPLQAAAEAGGSARRSECGGRGTLCQRDAHPAHEPALPDSLRPG